jgi:peptidoglycan LD-endopeptidase CwlK
MYKFSRRSLAQLATVHRDLKRLACRALELSPIDFGIVEGRRSDARQVELVAAGKSWTYNSRHLTGHAIDVYAWRHGKVDWSPPYYEEIFGAFAKSSGELRIAFVWGGHWKQQDLGHFELGRLDYPEDKAPRSCPHCGVSEGFEHEGGCVAVKANPALRAGIIPT